MNKWRLFPFWFYDVRWNPKLGPNFGDDSKNEDRRPSDERDEMYPIELENSRS